MRAIALWIVSVAVLTSPAAALRVERLGRVRGLSVASEGAEVVSGEALVRFSSSTSSGARAFALASIGGRVLRELPSVGWTHVELPAGMSVAEGLAQLRSSEGVLDVQPNHALRSNLGANDPYFWTQYHLNITNASSAWDEDTGGTNKVTIAVIDAGVEGSHVDLSSKFSATQSRDCTAAGCATANNPPTPACNHATRVAGVAAAASNNGIGVAGVSWGAQLVSLKIFADADCIADCSNLACASSDVRVIDALDYARTVYAANPAVYGRVVVNLSIGDETAACPAAVATAIGNAWDAGLVVVISAGNGNQDIAMPANCGGAAKLIPVGATDDKDVRASFSDFGGELRDFGVVAPGVNMVTTNIGGGVTGSASGTSFSAPFVSGVAALMLSATPGLTPADVRTHIRSSCVDLGTAGNDIYYGAGRPNVCKAVKLAKGEDPAACPASSQLAGFAAADKVTAFPNPFRLSSASAVNIKVPENLRSSGVIKVFAADGAFVYELPVAGPNSIWDGKNTSGNLVATGVYTILVQSGSASARGRVAVIR